VRSVKVGSGFPRSPLPRFRLGSERNQPSVPVLSIFPICRPLRTLLPAATSHAALTHFGAILTPFSAHWPSTSQLLPTMLAAGKVDPTHTAPANLGFPDGGRGVAECAVSFPSGSPQLAGTYIKWGPNKVVWYTKAWAPCFHDLTRQLQLSWEFNRPPIRSYIDRAVPALESDDGGPIQIIWDQTLLPPQIFPSFHRSPLPPMEPTKAYPPLDEDRIVPSWKYYAPIFGDCWGKKGKEAAARCAQDPRLIHAQDCGRTLEAEVSSTPELGGGPGKQSMLTWRNQGLSEAPRSVPGSGRSRKVSSHQPGGGASSVTAQDPNTRPRPFDVLKLP